MNWELNKLKIDGKKVDFYLWFDSQQSKHGKQKMADYSKWQDQYKKVRWPWNFLCLVKMREWADEQRDWEGVYSWRRSVRYVYNTRNTSIQQTIKMLSHKIWLNVWLYNTFSTNLTRLLVPLVNPFIWCFVRIRTPVFFNFIGPVRDESWSATVITWPWKKTENKIMQAQLDGLICVTPAPLSLILIYQHEVFTAKEHIQNLILIKTGIWNWYCITLNSNNHISYKKYEISTCSLTNQTHTHKSVPKKTTTTKTV